MIFNGYIILRNEVTQTKLFYKTTKPIHAVFSKFSELSWKASGFQKEGFKLDQILKSRVSLYISLIEMLPNVKDYIYTAFKMIFRIWITEIKSQTCVFS